jgi:hypothetical protein
MSRELRVTVAIMIVALAVFSPVIFAAPGPANTNYLALVMHVVPPPTNTSVPTATQSITPVPTSRPTRTPISATATPTLPPPSYNNCQADPNPSAAPNYPVRIMAIDKVAETVTLKNVSTETISLSGWHMCSITGNQQHPISGALAPGASQTFAGPAGSIWNNTNPDPGALYNPNGQLVSYFTS